MYCEVWEVIPQIYKKHIVCFMPTAEKLQTIETRLNNSVIDSKTWIKNQLIVLFIMMW